MKVRSVTSFVKAENGGIISSQNLEKLTAFNQSIRETLSESEFQLQSLRCATDPFPGYLADRSQISYVHAIQHLEQQLMGVGFDYISVGSIDAEHVELFPLIPDIIENTSSVFATAQLVNPVHHTISISAVKAAAKVIHELSYKDENGFSNLFFAAMAQVPAGIPFLPAAYKSPNEIGLSFALAMESADLAVEAFSSASSLEQAGAFYREAIEQSAIKLVNLISPVGNECGLKFLGFDFTPAPFIVAESSAAGSLELLSGQPFGSVSSVSASAFLMSALDNANFLRSGFNGLMLPVLEDGVLAQRVADGQITIKDLLLYSTVCGTGLDTVPLPGDISEEALQSLLLDIASLSVRLAKPLTARLMPIPGKKAGEMTSFDFPFFTNTRVMSPLNAGLSGLFSKSETVALVPR